MTATALAPTTAQAERLVSAFLAGRNERTRRAYSQDLEDFRVFVGAEDVNAAAALLLGRGHGEANALALSYKAALTERGLSAATINRRLAALRSLVKLGRVLGAVPWTLEVRNAKAQPYRDTRGPGRDGFRSLLAKLEGRADRKASRDRAILRLLYERGLRRGEVVSLDLEHLDLDAGTVAVLGKGRTAREPLTLAEPTLVTLRAWLEVRGVASGPLFANLDRGHHGERLTGAGLYRMVRELGEAAGIRVRPHGLRHAAITEALERTKGDLRAVQRFSRHRDLRLLPRLRRQPPGPRGRGSPARRRILNSSIKEF
jgi:integrase/recombinase XerC